MRLIVGLGNPGKNYKQSRHNIGFMVVKKIAQKKETVFDSKPDFESKIAELGGVGTKINLVKPQTFMNESGQAVSRIKNFYKVDSDDIWVINDDVDLPLGKVRIQFEGSSAGHRGIQSVIDNIGSDFWRIRVGIGRSEKLPTDVWVLQNFSESEQKKVEDIIDYLADYLIKISDGKITAGTLTWEEK